MNTRLKLDRFFYYLRHTGIRTVPSARTPHHVQSLLQDRNDPEFTERLAYYIRLPGAFTPGPESTPFTLKLEHGQSTYQLDLWDACRHFPPGLRVARVFGDNITEPAYPALVKSRPVATGPSNAVLFRLNHIRHFHFVRDPLPFHAKRNQLVWRGNAFQPRRRTFLEQYFDHPLCDIGHYHKHPQPDIPWARSPLSIREQLQSKFILAIEGNDVATNLKWALASNSLCFMTRPRYETWFMEGALIPGIHYVELADDGHDFDAKLNHYLDHPDEALPILRAANAWTDRFRNLHQERRLAIAALAAYFQLSGQGDFGLKLPFPAQPGS